MLGMTQRKLRNLLLFFGVLYLSFGTETCYAQDKSDDIKKVLKERRDLFSEAVDVMTRLLVASRITVQEVLQAEQASLKADLDLLDKPEDRIRAIEKHMKAADTILDIAKMGADAARVPRYAVSLAKAYVLEVQNELLTEKEKQKAKSGK